MAPKDTVLYDLLGVTPEATDLEYVASTTPAPHSVAFHGAD